MNHLGTRLRARALLVALTCTVLVASGIAAAANPQRSAAEKQAPPTCDPAHPGYQDTPEHRARCEEGEDPDPALPEPFTSVEAFAVKTGFRGIVTWSASTPIVPVVRYGLDPANLDQTATLVDTPDTAGVAVLGDGITTRLEIGKTYYVSVEDQVTGVVTPPIELVAKNAYSDFGPNVEQDPTEVSYKPEVYTIDLLVQLDAQSLPEDIPADLALEDIAAGINVFAERLYDALDGHARVGKVLVTDTNVGGLGATPDPALVYFPALVPYCDRPGTLADVLVTTGMPLDSHTIRYGIDAPCRPFYLGRVGQLVIPWEDDLHLGHVAVHEMMHYAFGAPDLYGNGDVTGTDAGGCRNLAWDGSVMHNSGGWNVDHWELTELDTDATLTPCAMDGNPYTWDEAQARYTQLPERAVIEDMFNTKARGNPDGGALEITILDREPGSSHLRAFTPDDTNPAVAACPAGTLTTSFTDATGDATSVLGLAEGPAEVSSPALDIVAERATLDAAGETLTIELEVDDLATDAPPGSVGEWFDLNFQNGDVTYDVVAAWDRTAGDPTFTLDESTASGRVEIAGIDGTWDVDTDVITVVVPAEVTLADDTTRVVFEPGHTLRSWDTTSRRQAVVVVPDADHATGGCSLVVPGDETTTTPAGPDATLTADRPHYSFSGEATTAIGDLGLGGVVATGSDRDEKVLEVVAPDGGTLSAALVASPTSYASIELLGPGGRLDYAEAAAGTPVTVSGPVTSGTYHVVVTYLVAAASTYDATVALSVGGSPPSGIPDGAATLGSGGSASFDGTVGADATSYECTGPFDPACFTYEITVTAAGDLLAAVSAGVPIDDFDVYIYDAQGTEVGSGGAPLTPPAGLESAVATVGPGTYYVVVQPYIATGGVSTFTLDVSLG